MSKYFVVDSDKVADIMSTMTGESFYIFHDTDKDIYSFIRSEKIVRAYGTAMRIIKNL